jgi:choline dehydrogenase-like flavoprotein
MHFDARTLDNEAIIEGDICIIGAGAAGISMALQWINKPYKVILLEGGGFDPEQEMQDLFKGKSTGQRYYPLQSSRLHYFGGTTGHWAGFCSDFDALDFKKRSWVANSGWPIDRNVFDAFYPRAHEILELGPYRYDLDYWQALNPRHETLPFDNKVLWNKVWQFSPPTRFGTKYRDAIVQAPNIMLYTHANVTQLELNENGRAINEVVATNLAGKTQRVTARYFVLACCAIQNARLLLNSSQQAKQGIGNDRDQVGRYFMEHLEVNSADLYFNTEKSLPLYSWDPFVTKMRAEIAFTEKIQEQESLLNGTISLRPFTGEEPEAFINTFSDDAIENVKRWNNYEETPKRKVPREPAHHKHYHLFTRIEQAPNPNSRITLDKEKDALGMFRTSLHWDITPIEKRSIRKLYYLLGQQMGIAGIGRVKLMEWLRDETDDTWPSIVGGGWHHMGTTRMHDDPNQGVVDPDCKVHGLTNLFVAGSSCFTTAGAVNPTLTLIALTLRLSDHLLKKISSDGTIG